MALSPGKLRDEMGNGDVTRVSTAAFSTINALQNHREDMRPGECVVAIAAAFVLAMEVSRLPLHDVLACAGNIMADAEGRRPEFKAITDYIKNEVLI